MNIYLACPAPIGSVKGNRVTAERWAKVLRTLRHHVVIGDQWRGEPCDLLVALHARKSHPSLAAYRETHPTGPAILCLTGTDLYRDFPKSKQVWQSLAWADRIVVLHRLAIDRLPAEYRDKAVVIHQSVPPLTRPVKQSTTRFDLCVLGHLRWEKDPLRAAMALRHVSKEFNVRLTQVGESLDPRYAEQARRLMEKEERYRWLGPVSRSRARTILARSRAMIISSRLEGGANVVSEAIVLGVPIVASRIDGNVGLLGDDYPAYFPVGDGKALGELIERVASDAAFHAELRRHLRRLNPAFSFKQECASWRELLEARK